MADTRIFNEDVFRAAVTHFEVNKDPASAQRILTGVGVVLRMLDTARAEVEQLRARVPAAEARKEIRYVLAHLTLDHGHDDIISIRADLVTEALAELFAKRTGAGQ